MSTSCGALNAEDKLRVEYPSVPSLKNLTAESWGQPAAKANPALRSLGKPHVDSFNYMLGDGLRKAVEDLPIVEFQATEDVRLSIKITECTIETPRVPPGSVGVKEPRVFPAEARQKGGSYKGRATIRYAYAVNGIWQPSMEKCLGFLPVMLLSDACNLSNLDPPDLVRRGEQETEWGGYFVIGGHERLIRMLQTTRRNYPIAMSRPSWRNRGRNFSDLGVLLECGKRDLTTIKNVLHYVTTGTAKFMFNIGKELFFVPVVMLLKCLSDRSDAGIFAELTAGCDPEDHYYAGCLRNMLTELQDEGLFSSEQVRQYMGASFREKLKYRLPEWSTDDDIVDHILSTSVCTHVVDYEDKFQTIAIMVKKLFALVSC